MKGPPDGRRPVGKDFRDETKLGGNSEIQLQSKWSTGIIRIPGKLAKCPTGGELHPKVGLPSNSKMVSPVWLAELGSVRLGEVRQALRMAITYGTGRIWGAHKMRLAWLHAEFFPIAIQMHLPPPFERKWALAKIAFFGP